MTTTMGIWGANHGFPRGPGEASQCREAKIAARQVLPLSFRAIALTVGAILKEEKMPSLVGRGNLGGIVRDNSCEGNCGSKIAARQSAVGSQFLPRDIKRALWVPKNGFRNTHPEDHQRLS